jgi:hypothetical protein
MFHSRQWMKNLQEGPKSKTMWMKKMQEEVAGIYIHWNKISEVGS